MVAYCCLHCGEIQISCRILHVVCIFHFRFRGTGWARQSIFYKTKRVCQFRFRFRISFTVVANLALTVSGVGMDSCPEFPGVY